MVRLCTFSGKKIDLTDLKPADLAIEDVAHALSLINRFNGHTTKAINVAYHSVFVALLVPYQHKLQALLHDASEAYLGDITHWLKQTPGFQAYRDAEAQLQRMIYRHFGCGIEEHETVARADKLMCRYEMTRGWPDGKLEPFDIGPSYPALSREDKTNIERLGWKFAGPEESERCFLALFNALTFRCTISS